MTKTRLLYGKQIPLVPAGHPVPPSAVSTWMVTHAVIFQYFSPVTILLLSPYSISAFSAIAFTLHPSHSRVNFRGTFIPVNLRTRITSELGSGLHQNNHRIITVLSSKDVQ